MANILLQHLEELKEMNWQRRAWLMLSALVLIVIVFLVFDNSTLEHQRLIWPFGVLGITLSVVWWYWSMRLIGRLITHRKEETEVLLDICESVKEMRDEVRKSFTN